MVKHVISNKRCVDQRLFTQNWSTTVFSYPILINHCLPVPIHVNHRHCFTILVELVLLKQNIFEGPLKSKVTEDSFTYQNCSIRVLASPVLVRQGLFMHKTWWKMVSLYTSSVSKRLCIQKMSDRDFFTSEIS